MYKHQISEGTCQWLLEDGMFQSWKGDHGIEQPLIWVGDGRGVGKTTLAVFISTHLEEARLNPDDYWVLYYFCDSRTENRNTAASILKGFMYQLYKKQNELATVLLDEYRIQHDSLFHPHSIEPLWRIWRAMLNRSRAKRIFCIIDGVDQCDEPNLDHFLRKINTHFVRHNDREASKKGADIPGNPTGHLPDGNTQPAPPAQAPELRMIVLTREHPSCVTKELCPFPRLVLKRHAVKAGEPDDLQRHIDAKVDKVVESCSGKDSGKETTKVIAEALSNGEDRSFLWVNLAAEKLMDVAPNQLKKHLAKLPESVEGIYVQTLLELPSRRRTHVCAILKWAALAARPLSSLELTKAIKYTLHKSFSRRMLKKALQDCRGLVEDNDDKISLADHAVQDFLFEDQSALRQDKKLKDFVFDRSNVHSEMANTCIAYLQESANLAKSRRVRLKPGDSLKPADLIFFSKHPFLEYAMVHWMFHAKQGNADKTNYGVAFFQDDSVRRRLWWESYWISLRQTFAWKWTAPGRFSLLHLAAFFNIVPLAIYVEDQGRIIELLDAEDQQGMKPINRATERSQASMVKFLLQQGAFDNDALRQAARTGEAAIIMMLLENREKLLHSPRLASTKSWSGASVNPFQSIKKVTLSSISDWSKKYDQPDDDKLAPLSPDVQGYGKVTSESPLHIAATCGHEDAIDAFLAAGEDYNMATEGGWTCLHNATWFGRVTIVNRLVAAGADPKAVTKELMTPLHCAVKNSQVAVVEYLLSTRVVDIEAVDQFGFTPFHMACRANNIPMMEVLLDYGASIERRMRQGWTPLLWACINGQYTVVQFLLNKGADVGAKWVQACTDAGRAVELGAIGLAKAYKHERIAHLMERFGAIDINRVHGEELEALPPAKAAEEDYTLPEVADIVVTHAEDSGTVSVLDDDDLGSGGSGDDSDDGSEASGGGSGSRKQSTSSIQDVTGRRPSRGALLGLGIEEEVVDNDTHGLQNNLTAVSENSEATREVADITNEKAMKRKPAGVDHDNGVSTVTSNLVTTAEACAEPAEEGADAIGQNAIQLNDLEGAREGSYLADGQVTEMVADQDNVGTQLGEVRSGAEAVGLKIDETRQKPSSRDADQNLHEETSGLPDERRSSSVSQMLGVRFGRFVPKSHGTNGTPSEDKADPFGGSSNVDDEKADTFGKFKRVLSWKNEAAGEGPLLAQGKPSETSERYVAPESAENGSEAPVSHDGLAEAGSEPAPDRTFKIGRFGMKRGFSWKPKEGEKSA